MSDCETFRGLLTAEFPEVSFEQAARLFAHWELLVRWNKALNLTRVTSLAESVERHYCEALFLAMQLGDSPQSVVDIGSGGGFPGVPVAIVRSQFAVTLVESHQRKAVFLREATRDLRDVRVEARRAEDLPECTWDWVISRAVRWPDVIPVAARGIALLVGEEDAEELSKQKTVLWRPPKPLPWGKRRILMVGQRVTG